MLCSVMGVSTSGYYSWLKHRKNRPDRDAHLLEKVQQIHTLHRKVLGSRRMGTKITEYLNISCGRYRAGTLMRKAGIEVKRRKKFRHTTDSKHNLPVAPNLLERQFTSDSPGQAWVSDITYIWTHQGWLYLAVVLDLYDRKVIGWSMNTRMNKELVISALKMAIQQRTPQKGAIFHSDRGSQYCSKKFQKMLELHGMRSSMSRKGNCWDNAVAESFFASLKKELIHLEEFDTITKARHEIFDYIEIFYNRMRPHSALNYVSPSQVLKEVKTVKFVLKKVSTFT